MHLIAMLLLIFQIHPEVLTETHRGIYYTAAFISEADRFASNSCDPHQWDHVYHRDRLTGAYVLDTESPGHHWNEIHPVSKIEVLP